MRAASILVAAIATAPASAQIENDEFSRNVVASAQFGAWRAEAADFKGYTYSPQLACRMSAPGASLIQTRPNESGRLDAKWILLADKSRNTDQFGIDWIKVDRTRYEAASLPWRLVGPTDNGIILTFDIPLLAVRKSPQSEWLPASYLTLPLFEARRFEVGFHAETAGQVKRDSVAIPLEGFRAAAKWCGRQLLRDRLRQKRVDELTR